MSERVIYVDVDDTLVRSVGSTRIPMPGTVEYVQAMKAEGATLYCWSSGGATYAKETAEELGIADCFEGFLPKPQMIIDDQNINDWRGLFITHPLSLPRIRRRDEEETY